MVDINNIPRVGVMFILKKDDKILMLKRKGSHASGTWAFVGGHLDFMETVEKCVARECLEETNIKVKNVEILGITQDFYKEENKHYITIVTKCEYDSGELKIMEPHKCDAMDWFDINNIPSPLMLSTENTIKDFKRYL
ncbi:MAG: NUDIX domain-containing protein [Candidatus Gracilibacteria bacterium]|nr:NUDIX domain-containing protein [Candidatus Gracilibacteria bacterium]